MAAEKESADTEEADDEVKERKRKERLEQNRISARESRKRKKTMIEELQRTVISLSRENKELNDTNAALRKQLMELATKYPNVISMPAHAPPPVNSADAAAAASTAAEATAIMGSQVPQPPAQQPHAATAFPAGMFFFPPTGQWDPAQFQQQAQQIVQQAAQQQAQVPSAQVPQQQSAPEQPAATTE